MLHCLTAGRSFGKSFFLRKTLRSLTYSLDVFFFNFGKSCKTERRLQERFVILVLAAVLQLLSIKRRKEAPKYLKEEYLDNFTVGTKPPNPKQAGFDPEEAF